MDNELKDLIESFKGYRDLLVPVQRNLADFTATYDAMKENIDKLNASFGGDVKQKVEDVFRQMSGQAAKAADLSSRIDQLAASANRYAAEMNSLVGIFAKIEERLTAVNALEGRAEAQIARIEAILEEKSKSYNLKELQAALDRYNQDVKKVADFINKDVADTMKASHDRLDAMKNGLDGVVKARSGEGATLEKLMQSFSASEGFLKRISEKADVNEAYVFELLDRWAESRKVKTKR
ncbi:MAG: hypothetical protein FWD58_10040 [Firmicutes bacterium]|nr:hypothetical protein [Bacillota bacterium]